jgi:restriction system protein
MSWFNSSEKKKLHELKAAETKKALELEEAEKSKAQELEAAEKARLKELELSKPIEVMKAGFVAGTEFVNTNTSPIDIARILTNFLPVENCALQCWWQIQVLIGEGKSARSVMLDLASFISVSEYEQSRSCAVFVAHDQPITYPENTPNGRLIYYRETLFLVSRPCKNKVEREEALFRAAKIIDDELLEPVKRLINQHIATLSRKWGQTIYRDDYGNLKLDRWLQEFDYFFDNVLRKDRLIAASLTSPQRELWAKENAHKDIVDAIFKHQATQVKSNPHLSVNVDGLDPLEFEHYCADMLRSSGWDVRVTLASGDQGIDLIAIRGNVKAVFQCKKYSQPVGNGAVQEIIAGKHFEQAHIAAVVSNSTYTQSAKQLATTTGVHLLHFTELVIFAEMAGVV